ncbi:MULTISPECIES: NADH:flavin oxidoreductase/NADH oxidase [unclassified Cryobacterium]|uniref:NADH:flavin oxidoreductase/NADH oxidase n=1 Tax=unclassified Cryobacterium TaxID=2649013 RepID=UPI002AB579B8|nr:MULTISPECIES: NADH:flavin oxidoreductase/NADH oxidase [unclassified Cryobacterium]MDY7526584.1 NADH:flavin oxidoreductase/NADH oxidase [Cryobacterium sp. 10C2]MDY7557609.1 NADH:flavin oxidoreductase/NADH oxidase [Cryobacterium sp. 10C3]MEB0290550.1 NADH:flavin oxidoreductase/NADH oxidase [Cryobacterium sp. 10C2]
MNATDLFTPMTIRSVEIRNRAWVPPMCQYSVFLRDGVPTNWHLVHLGAMAVGGAGLVMAEATAISPDGRITVHDCGIWNDEQRDAWAPIVDFIHEQGSVAGIQLAHAGRKASVRPDWNYAGAAGPMPASEGGWVPLAPSEIPFDEESATPREMTYADIDRVIRDFRSATRRAVDAGFQVLEIHAAHGYLVHEFLSPLSNKRTDEYGGSLEDRARLLLEIVDVVRDEVGPDLAVFVRFSATDWIDGGWTPEETSIVARWCADRGVDLFDISTGGNIPGVPIPAAPSYQVAFSAQVRRTAGVPTATVGLIFDPEIANQIVVSGQADAVMFGREHMRDAHFVLRASVDLGIEIDYWPAQYLRSRPRKAATGPTVGKVAF